MIFHVEDFVDREEQLTTLWQIVRQETDQRILLIRGPAGMGKAYLLDEFHAQCRAGEIACARLDFAESADQHYIAIVLRVLRQLGLGGFEDLTELIANPHALDVRQRMPTPRTAPDEKSRAVDARPSGDHDSDAGLNTSQVTLDDGISRDEITGIVGDVGAGAQVGIGKEIEFRKTFYLSVQHDDPLVQRAIQDHVTAALQDRLLGLTRTCKAVFLLSAWERVTTETDEWLCQGLLSWILDNKLPGAVAVVAGLDVPDLHRLPRRIGWCELKELPDRAVRTYWVEKCGLPSDDVPQLIEISGGLPLAMVLTAERYFQEGSAALEPKARNMDTVRLAVEGLLAAIPPQVADAVCLGAIPHTFDRKLLQCLCGAELDIAQVMPRLERFRFLRRGDQGRFRYPDGVRDCLLAWWRREQPDRYVEANRAARAHFGVLAKTEASYKLDELYHLLICDQAKGMRALSTQFEDACGHYDLVLAEQLVSRVTELEDSLEDKARAWLRYFEARLLLAHGQGNEVKDTFQDLADHALDPILRAVARWNLGQILVAQKEWSQAIRLYRASLDSLRREGSPEYLARVMLACGDAYRALAENSGAFYAGSDEVSDGVSHFLRTLQHLPFLVYEWLVRRVRFLPNWFFGTNYQDWIIAYLLMEATRWYRRAERQLRGIGDTLGLAEARLSLGELEHQLGRWSRAQQRFATLLEADEIKSSDYRKARVRLGQGWACLNEKDLDEAEAALSEAVGVFRHFEDNGSLGIATALLGRVYATLDRRDEAVLAYGESIQAFRAVGDDLARTQVAWALEDMAEQSTLQEEQRRQIDAIITQVTERHYIARFPDSLHRWFRRLALLGALPLTYVLTFIIGMALVLTLMIVEGEVLLPWTGVSTRIDLVDGLILFAAATLPVPTALWLYRLIYSLMGIAFVYFLGRRLAPIQNAQPSRLVTDATGLTHHEAKTDAGRTLAWSDVTALASVDYCQRRRAIHLISFTILSTKSETPSAVHAITTGYAHLQKDIARRLGRQPGGTKPQSRNFVLFDGRWTLAAIGVSLALIPCLAYLRGNLDMVVYEGMTLVLSSIMYAFVPTFQFTFSAMVLWRLVSHRLTVRRAVGYQPRTIPSWLLWLAAILSTAVAVLWLVLLATTS
jgi:tetratricopeptide (TPR) repeat protein